MPLEDLPPELLEPILWQSFNPNLFLVSHAIKSVLPSYRDYEHDLALVLFADTTTGCWSSSPQTRLWRTLAAKDHPFQLGLDERLALQRSCLSMPWFTLRNFQHLLTTLASEWCQAHCPTLDMYPYELKLFNERVHGDKNLLVTQPARFTARQKDFRVVVWPGARTSVAQSIDGKYTKTPVRPVVDIALVPDWILTSPLTEESLKLMKLIPLVMGDRVKRWTRPDGVSRSELDLKMFQIAAITALEGDHPKRHDFCNTLLEVVLDCAGKDAFKPFAVAVLKVAAKTGNGIMVRSWMRRDTFAGDSDFSSTILPLVRQISASS